MQPAHARRAPGKDPVVGALLPCSVAVREEHDGTAKASAVDPMQAIAAAEPALAPIAAEVREALARTKASL